LHAPSGIDEPRYQWIDLHSEGISGLLTEQAEGLFYKSNLGGGKFSAAKSVGPKPTFKNLSIQELEGNGVKQFVQLESEPKGFFELNTEGEWQSFRTFGHLPNINFRDKNIKQLDLNGDGIADMLLTEEEVFTWYPSEGKKGFGTAHHATKMQDEEKGPAMIFNDESQSIFLSDINGDGLTDLVRVRNGEVCYWPNLGFGRFGAKVNMDNSPLLDSADQFNTKFIQLADIDGSGTPDLVYFGKSKYKIWMNRQGNGFAQQAVEIFPFAELNNYTKVSMLDLLGNGVSCIVWNCALPNHIESPLKYVDLMNSKKPHIMTMYRNNMGKETFLEYRSSTHYYLEDKLAGVPWITKLAFPVHCVAKTIVIDRIRKLRFASEYTYHHGYYDSKEREFRGFGRVEQTDSEEIDHFVKKSGGMMNNIEEKDLQQFPVLIKSWFHTGAFLDKSKILDLFSQEYFQNNQHAEYKMPEPLLEILSDNEDWREALRACKGTTLRKEVYALDKSGVEDKPYLVEQHNVMVKRVQEKAVNKHGIFFIHESESIVYHYERDPSDPKMLHKFNVEVDAYGNVVRAVTVAYGRSGKDTDLQKSDQDIQSKQHITCVWNDYTDASLNLENDYRLPLLWQSRTYEITNNPPPLVASYFSIAEMEDASNPLKWTNILYHEIPAGVLTRRLIEWVRTKFRADDGIAILDFGKLKPKSLVHETYKAAFTPALLDILFAGKTTAAALDPVLTASTGDGGGYLKEDGHYWIASGKTNYVAANFFLPTQFTDTYNKTSIVEYGAYNLFISKVTDPKLNVLLVTQFNYRVLQPLCIKDANLNTTAVRFDELAMVTAVFAIGKNADKGDVFDVGNDETSPDDKPGTEFNYFLSEWYNQILGGVDTNNYYKPQPNYAYSKTWEVHYKFNTMRSTEYQETYMYFDATGNPILTKKQAEPGLARHVKNDGTVEIINTSPNKRWIGNGRTILNNKGKPVKQYEPYFSVNTSFDDEKEMVELGCTSILHYDPLDRLIKTEQANGSFSSVSFSAWKQESYDENDTISDSNWNATVLAYLQSLPDNTPDLLKRKQYRIVQHQRANTITQAHANTPTRSYSDALGRAFLIVADNKTGKLKARTFFDIEDNVRMVTDAMDREVMKYDYDMLGNKVRQDSMDGGKRWGVNDVKGQPILAYDDRGFIFTIKYDELRRPVESYVVENAEKKMFERFVYGEVAPLDTDNNLRGKLWTHYDQAGIVVNIQNDFKGNSLSTSRQLCDDYQDTIKWDNIPAVMMDGDPFISDAEFDALNRPLSITSPHRFGIPSSIVVPEYNLGGLLEKLKANLRDSGAFTEFVTKIDYNAKRQRETIVYKNGSRTGYEYDPFNYRLTAIKTTRLLPAATLQDIVYAHDPLGNITAIRDDSQDEKVYDGEVVDPENSFLYDALYRLTQAQGRKHAGQCLVNHSGVNNNFRNHPFIASPDPNDVNAICNYKEDYTYDNVGNLKEQKHTSKKFPWTRTFKHGIVADDNKNNRLKETDVGGPAMIYDYDAHGNMQKMEHMPVMRWNFKDYFQGADLSGSRKVFYVYDNSGERVRKVIHDDMNRKEKERIYLSGFEIYREYTPAGIIDLERESLHIADDKRRVVLVETLTREKSADIPNPQLLQRYQYDNHLGSASLELDDSASIITYEEYFPFGTTSYQYGRSEKEVQEKRYRYTGKERDEESGLGYHSARYYASWLCRWTAADPIGIGDGLNRYSYVKNNPIKKIDPEGKAEADTSTVDVNKLRPINEELNKLVNEAMEDVRKDMGIKPGDKLTDKQRKEFALKVSELGIPRGGSIIGALRSWHARDAKYNKTFIEKYAEKNFDNKEAGNKYEEAIKRANVGWKGLKGTYWAWKNNLGAYTVGKTAVNPGVVVVDKTGTKVAIGTDKIGHFFAQGYQMFEESVLDKKGDTAGENLSHKQEMTIFGLGTTGVYSFADREANREGMQFYKDIMADPFMTFDIAKYTSTKWNEDINTNVNSRIMEDLLISSGKLPESDRAINEERLKKLEAQSAKIEFDSKPTWTNYPDGTQVNKYTNETRVWKAMP
jgi:RHS repeat-associated protein